MSKTTPLHVHHAFLYISFPSLHDYDVKMPIFTFCWGRKHKATTFFFFFWTSIQSFRIQLQKRLARLTKWMRESRLDKVWSSATSLFKWRFGSRRRGWYYTKKCEFFEKLSENFFCSFSHLQWFIFHPAQFFFSVFNSYREKNCNFLNTVAWLSW